MYGDEEDYGGEGEGEDEESYQSSEHSCSKSNQSQVKNQVETFKRPDFNIQTWKFIFKMQLKAIRINFPHKTCIYQLFFLSEGFN